MGAITKYLVLCILNATLMSLAGGALAQDTDPHEILAKLLESHSKIQDYEARVEIEVDVEFIKMPVKTATIYYRQPDKIRFKADEFLMLPKKNMSQSSVYSILEGDYNAVYVGEDYIEGVPYHYVKVIPFKTKEVVLTGLWIDTTTYLIRRMENFTKSGGNYLIDFEYYEELRLPSEMKITFQVEEFNIPLDFINRNIEIDKEKMKSDEMKTGYVYLRFSDYRINEGLDEQLFEDE